MNPTRSLERLTFERLSVALLFVAIGFTACLMPAQNDTWWQMRAGQETLDTGIIQLRDNFSHTVNGGHWPNHEWLSQVSLYALYRVGGLPLLTAVSAALVTLAWWIVWSLIPGHAMVRLALSTIAVAPFATGWAPRPQVFTLFFLALLTRLLVQRRYWLLPLLFLAWANLHGGVLLGVVVMGAAAFASMVSERRLLNRAAIATIVCALTTGITPIGFSLWMEVPAMIDRLREYGVSEWRPPGFDLAILPFWALMALFGGLVLVSKPWRAGLGNRSLIFWGALALLPSALGASRNVPTTLVLLVPAVGELLDQSRFRILRTHVRRREHQTLNASILALATVCALGAVAFSWSAQIPRLQWHPLPDRALAAVDSCSGELYNRYDEGGYLIWFTPNRKIFIDGRQDPYPLEFVREHIRVETTGDYEDTFRRYSIGCAFLPVDSPVAKRLIAARWKGLYRDAAWVVLAPNS